MASSLGGEAAAEAFHGGSGLGVGFGGGGGGEVEDGVGNVFQRFAANADAGLHLEVGVDVLDWPYISGVSRRTGRRRRVLAGAHAEVAGWCEPEGMGYVFRTIGKDLSRDGFIADVFHEGLEAVYRCLVEEEAYQAEAERRVGLLYCTGYGFELEAFASVSEDAEDEWSWCRGVNRTEVIRMIDDAGGGKYLPEGLRDVGTDGLAEQYVSQRRRMRAEQHSMEWE